VAIFGNRSDALKVFGCSLVLWFTNGLIYASGLRLFALDVPFLTGGITVGLVVAMAVSLPSTPGYVGAFELGCKIGLLIFGIKETEALAYSILLHSSQFGATVAAGLFFLAKENLSLEQIRKFGNPA
jgi:hypothetical protein